MVAAICVSGILDIQLLPFAMRRALPPCAPAESDPDRKPAQQLDILGVTLSRSSVFWLGQRVEKLQLGSAWVSKARAGQIGVTASQISVWERIASSDPKEVPYAVIFEDDAVLLQAFRRSIVRTMVDELDRGGAGGKNSSSSSSDDTAWHIAYIYLRPEDFPDAPSLLTVCGLMGQLPSLIVLLWGENGFHMGSVLKIIEKRNRTESGHLVFYDGTDNWLDLP